MDSILVLPIGHHIFYNVIIPCLFVKVSQGINRFHWENHLHYTVQVHPVGDKNYGCVVIQFYKNL